MTKMTATGTIELDPATPPVLGQPLNFICTTDGLKGNQNPRVQIVAYQDIDSNGIDDVVYAEACNVIADPHNNTPGLPFNPLGGASSEWLSRRGPARCVATLYYWDFHPNQIFVPLASIEFESAG